jgi:tetratricopeptide (TPR) repeat protein
VLLDPGLAPAWTLLAYSRRAAGDAPGARAAAERAATLAADDPLAQALLGEGLVADGRLDEAERALTAALRALPDDRGLIAALVQLGTAWQLRGDARAALRAFDLVTGKADEDAGWLLFSARALRALGRNEEARTRLEALVRLRPEYREAAFELAEVLAVLGRRADARQALDDAARRGLGNEELFRRLRELEK